VIGNRRINWRLCSKWPSIHECKNLYGNLKIKNKLFLIHFLMVMIVCLTSLIAIQVILNIYEEILGNESAKVLNLSSITIENELKQVERFTYNTMSNLVIQKCLEQLKNELPKYESLQEQGVLTDCLLSTIIEQNIISVSVIDAWGNQYSGGDQIPELITRQIIPKAVAKKGTMILIEPFMGDSTLFCARQIRKIRNLSLEPLGMLIVRVDLARLVRQSTAGLVNKEVNLLIISGKKCIYFSNPLLKEMVTTLKFKGNSGYSMEKINGKNYFVAHTKSALTGWVYVNILPFETVFRQIKSMRSIVLFIFATLFCCTIFISMKFARTLTRPLEILTAKMKQVENGKFEIEDEYEYDESQNKDEIGDLQKDFNIMIRKINTLIKEDYTKQIVIKDAQLKALLAQINPHFLYNTLESINWLAKLNKQADISMMVESLGYLLRSSISNQEQIITLEEEIRLIQYYITIQKIRFGERLDFRLEVDEKWNCIRIPKLSLQPVVENSINYGLEKILDVCRITVKASSESGSFVIIIADNGPGIDQVTLAKLEKGIIKPKGLGIGLKNINERIKLIFGEQFGIFITSELGEGTKVMIRIPKMEDENV
jgi:two-component system, sensor histidine kinase YesM